MRTDGWTILLASRWIPGVVIGAALVTVVALATSRLPRALDARLAELVDLGGAE